MSQVSGQTQRCFTSNFAAQQVTGTTNHYAGVTYDDMGDVTAQSGRTFTWDSLGVMTGATANGRIFRYLYSPDDERIAVVERVAGSGNVTRNKTTWSARDFGNHLLTTWTDDSTSGTRTIAWKEDEIWRGASLLANLSPSGTKHYVVDHLGSPRLLTNASGQSLGTQNFAPFGSGGSSNGGTLQFAGMERDLAAAGASFPDLPDYDHQRFYDLDWGQSTSVDPAIDSAILELPQSWNRYVYALNNPLKFIDPTGLRPCKITLNGEDARIAGVANGTKVDGVCVDATDPSTTPWKLGWEWLTGAGPRDRTFKDGDDMTELLKKHEHVQDVARKVCGGVLPPEGNAGYDLSGLGGVPKYLRDYSTLSTGGLTGNLAVTYLGSYQLQYSMTNGTVNMTVTNSSSAASAFRPPVLGYKDTWRKYVGRPINKFFSSGPLSQTTQTFDFSLPCS